MIRARVGQVSRVDPRRNPPPTLIVRAKMAWRRELKGWNLRLFSWVPDHHIEQGLARDGATRVREPRTRPTSALFGEYFRGERPVYLAGCLGQPAIQLGFVTPVLVEVRRVDPAPSWRDAVRQRSAPARARSLERDAAEEPLKMPRAPRLRHHQLLVSSYASLHCRALSPDATSIRLPQGG